MRITVCLLLWGRGVVSSQTLSLSPTLSNTGLPTHSMFLLFALKKFKKINVFIYLFLFIAALRFETLGMYPEFKTAPLSALHHLRAVPSLPVP